MKSSIVYSVFLVCIASLLFFSCSKDHSIFYSPDENITLEVVLRDNTPFYTLLYHSDTIVTDSELGLILNRGKINFLGIEKIEEYTMDETWELVWGKYSSIRNNYTEITYSFESFLENSALQIMIQFRIYNDGLAIRYILPEQKCGDTFFTIEEDDTHFNFNSDHILWATNREMPNIGPVRISDFKEIGKDELQTPVVFIADNDNYIGIHEADISNFAHIHLKKSEHEYGFRSTVLPSSGNYPDTTSWRVLLLGKSPGELIESNILENLCPPPLKNDFSWVMPGKSMWDWRVWKYVTDDGYEYGLNTDSHKRFIDFASENNIQYLLIDADWYGPEFSEDSDPVSAREGVNIQECMAYANEKNVGIILYLNDIGAKKFGLERVLKQFADWGAKGVKYGFMTGKGQEKVLHTRKVIELCAKYKLLVNFHDGPVPPSGDYRTFPNAITREYCHAQADAKRSYWPETAVSSVFINMIAGPLDMTNGWYGFDGAEKRERVFEFIPGTVAAETAKTVVFFSGLTVLPDAPEEYLKKDDIFDFIRRLPGKFEDFKVLQGEIGASVVIARKSGNDWFIGGLTNREERIVDVDTDFLDPGLNYLATLYKDAPDTHFIDNREAYSIEELSLEENDALQVRMAPGGGFALWIRPE